MGLMTEKQAMEKGCKPNEIKTAILIMAGLKIPKDGTTIQGLTKRAGKCEGRECMHWNHTSIAGTISADDLDDDGYIKEEAMERIGVSGTEEFMQAHLLGYCGFSTPHEEIEALKRTEG